MVQIWISPTPFRSCSAIVPPEDCKRKVLSALILIGEKKIGIERLIYYLYYEYAADHIYAVKLYMAILPPKSLN